MNEEWEGIRVAGRWGCTFVLFGTTAIFLLGMWIGWALR